MAIPLSKPTLNTERKRAKLMKKTKNDKRQRKITEYFMPRKLKFLCLDMAGLKINRHSESDADNQMQRSNMPWPTRSKTEQLVVPTQNLNIANQAMEIDQVNYQTDIDNLVQAMKQLKLN